MEHKTLTFACDIKALDDAPGSFEGYGSVFGNIDSYRDIVMPGAFKASLEQIGMPAMLWQHDMRQPIGVYKECYEDDKGLYIKGVINLDVQQGAEAYSLLKQGALKGMSIGYRTRVKELDETENVMRLKQVDLYEVSLVTFPANSLAQVTGVKSAATEREFEDFLREAGYSRSLAKLITAKGFKTAMQVQREAEGQSEEGLQKALNRFSEILERFEKNV